MLLLVTEANPRTFKRSVPSRLGPGNWRVEYSGKSTLAIILNSSIASHADIDTVIVGPCSIVIQMLEPHIEDKTLNVSARMLS